MTIDTDLATDFPGFTLRYVLLQAASWLWTILAVGALQLFVLTWFENARRRPHVQPDDTPDLEDQDDDDMVSFDR